jgi:hypothetical protein
MAVLSLAGVPRLKAEAPPAPSAPSVVRDPIIEFEWTDEILVESVDAHGNTSVRPLPAFPEEGQLVATSQGYYVAVHKDGFINWEKCTVELA